MTTTTIIFCLVVGITTLTFTQGKRSATTKPCKKNLGAYTPPKNGYIDKWQKYKKRCSNKVMSHISDFKCYQASRSDDSSVRSRIGWCSCANGLVAAKLQANVSAYSNHATYLIPRPDSRQLHRYPSLSPPLSLSKLLSSSSESAAINSKEETATNATTASQQVFVFIHIPKCGGTTVKDLLLKGPGGRHGCNMGAVRQWRQGLPAPYPNSPGPPPHKIVWGSMGMGLCDNFPGKPCRYFTLLRNPFDRAISEFVYFCVLGSEQKKKWTRQMKRNGKCHLTLSQYFAKGFNSPSTLIEHLTMGCDKKCGADAAIQNLRHGCMRYALLPRMSLSLYMLHHSSHGGIFERSSMEMLGKTLKPKNMTRTLKRKKNNTRPVKHKNHVNYAGLSERVRKMLKNPAELGKLRKLVAEDMRVWDAAVEGFEKQWMKPWTSCNQMF